MVLLIIRVLNILVITLQIVNWKMDHGHTLMILEYRLLKRIQLFLKMPTFYFTKELINE